MSKDVLKSWIGLGNYLPLIGGTMSGQITKSTGGSWIGDRDRAAIKSSYAGDSSYGAVAAMATKNGYWTMGNLGGDESLIFNYSTDAKYNAGKNETSQVYLPAQAGTIITSATTSEKQALLTSNLALYQISASAGQPFKLTWNSTGDECVEWAYEELAALALAIGTYVKPFVSRQQELELAIKACTTMEELDAIEINYDPVLKQYLETIGQKEVAE